MNRFRLAALACCAALCLAAAAANPPPNPKQPRDTKMANVYLLAHAGAILDVCMASPGADAFPEEKSREIRELSGRLVELVRTIGQHHRDAEVPVLYESTKARMAADTKLRFHVKNNHQYCGERTLGEMRAYVAGNEESFRRFFEQREGAKKAAGK
jgi:hypothetical protein